MTGATGSDHTADSTTGGSTVLAALEAGGGDVVRTDDDLARGIDAEHGHVEAYKHHTIEHTIRRGELLQ